MARFLTPKQKRVLETLGSYFAEFDIAPTLTELQDLLEIKTKRGVVKHLEALEKKGYIYRNGKSRGIFLDSGFSSEMYDIPILGYANAGRPLVVAEEEIMGVIKVDKKILPKKSDLFALMVKGDSMNLRTVNKIPILNQSYVVIEKSGTFTDGDVVLAVVDNAATIKTFKKSDDKIILYPESSNPIHTPIYLRNSTEAFINGKVIAVLESPTN